MGFDSLSEKKKKIKNPANEQCLNSIFIYFDSQIRWI